MKIVAFYTSEKYRSYAEGLRASAQRFGLETVLYDLPDRGSWTANVNYKPFVIFQALMQLEDDILYIDTDAEMVRPPVALPTAVERDVYATFLDHERPVGGTLYFRKTPEAAELCWAWIQEVKKRPAYADDFVNLRAAAQSLHVKIGYLPPAYCWHEPTMRRSYPTAIPVIVQHCAGEHTYKT